MVTYTYRTREFGPEHELFLSDTFLAVRTKDGGSIYNPDRLRAADARTRGLVFSEVAPVTQIPHYGVQLFRSIDETADELGGRLAASLDLRFARPVLIDSSGEPVSHTENIYVSFAPGCTEQQCEQTLREAGATIKTRFTYPYLSYFVSAPDGVDLGVFEIADAIGRRPGVASSSPELIRRRSFRVEIPQEAWHLKRTEATDHADANVNIEPAWAEGYRGQGVVIAVIDNGFDVAHREFNVQGGVPKIKGQTRVSNAGVVGLPVTARAHGTSVAGVAAGQGLRAPGVAPDARLVLVQISGDLGSGSVRDEACAIRWAVDQGADVINCSFGPRQTGPITMPQSTREALEDARYRGRNGRGCIVTWAAGNDDVSIDRDEYLNHEYVLGIAESDHQALRVPTSNFGRSIFCCFPGGSRPFDGKGIWTSDVSGSAGDNPGLRIRGDETGDYRNDFHGTSAAAPGVAGIAALVLSANPDLPWGEVKRIIAETCFKIDTAGGGYLNGRSNSYGFGRPDARRAVLAAV
jgi:subtilisin family serine protease